MSNLNIDEMMKSLDPQNAEFDALTRLGEKWQALQRVAVVDDDYPEARHGYEAALRDFVQALRVNRPREFEKGLPR